MAKCIVRVKEVNHVSVEVDFEDGTIPSNDTLKSCAIEEIRNGYGKYDETEYEFVDKEIIKN